jgi:hypothetical protein
MTEKRWEDDIKMHLWKRDCENERWVELFQDGVQWRPLVSAELNVQVRL